VPAGVIHEAKKITRHLTLDRHVADAQIITVSFRERPDAVISTVSDGTSKRIYLVIEALAKRVSSMQDI